MLKEGFNGFCMALADSVPGVSGGSIAFIMGFYDAFISSIHNVVFGKKEERINALKYLMKLGIGWGIGMILAVLVLSSMFESHIYMVSSLFLGFIAGSIPLIIKQEKDSVKEWKNGILAGVAGFAIVVGITILNSSKISSTMNMNGLSITTGIKLFFIGMIAISAMFLPGISGSTLLLIFGAYMPVMNAIKNVLSLHLSYLPALIFFGCGILFGAMSVVKLIQVGLKKYRVQMIYMILGMMVGSFFAIVQGPTTLDIPQAALSFSSFHLIAFLVGLGLVLGIEIVKERSAKHGA